MIKIFTKTQIRMKDPEKKAKRKEKGNEEMEEGEQNKFNNSKSLLLKMDNVILPERLRKYKIEETIYDVSSTTVYKVSKNGRLFAMKVLDETIMDGTVIETNTLSIINNPNIIKKEEIYIDYKKKKTYIIMEYAPKTVKDLEDKDLYQCIYECFLGLDYLHHKEIIHGDIKPDNIFMVTKPTDLSNILKTYLPEIITSIITELSEDSENSEKIFKIGDFGLSQYQRANKSLIIQTPQYRAPEIYNKDRNYSVSIDIWSMGIMIVELINKKSFLSSLNEEEIGERYIKSGAINLISNLKGHKLYPLIVRCLKKDPKDRLTAKEAIRDKLFNKFKSPPKRKIIIVRKDKFTIENDINRYFEASIKTQYHLNKLKFLYISVIRKLSLTSSPEDKERKKQISRICKKLISYLYNIGIRDEEEDLIATPIKYCDVIIMDAMKYKLTE